MALRKEDLEYAGEHASGPLTKSGVLIRFPRIHSGRTTFELMSDDLAKRKDPLNLLTIDPTSTETALRVIKADKHFSMYLIHGKEETDPGTIAINEKRAKKGAIYVSTASLSTGLVHQLFSRESTRTKR